MTSSQSVVDLLKTDPGNELFIGYAEGLRAQGELREALAVCLAGLSANPGLHQGRLLLGRIFFELGYPLFAAREVRELLQRFPHHSALQELLARLEPGGVLTAAEAITTVMEQEFDIAELERLAPRKD